MAITAGIQEGRSRRGREWPRSAGIKQCYNIEDFRSMARRRLLVVRLLHGGRFDISTKKPERFTFIVFYRELTARSASRKSVSPCSNRRWREGARSRSDIVKARRSDLKIVLSAATRSA